MEKSFTNLTDLWMTKQMCCPKCLKCFHSIKAICGETWSYFLSTSPNSYCLKANFNVMFWHSLFKLQSNTDNYPVCELKEKVFCWYIIFNIIISPLFLTNTISSQCMMKKSSSQIFTQDSPIALLYMVFIHCNEYLIKKLIRNWIFVTRPVTLSQSNRQMAPMYI